VIATPLSLPCRRARGECVVLNKDFQQGFSTRHTPHRNDLNTDFPLRIGDVAGEYYPGAIAVHMADKTVLAMKVASETGEVRVMHAVPHTLAAVGFYKGDDALREAIRNSKRFMDHANQNVGKHISYLGITVLVELESRQELN